MCVWVICYWSLLQDKVIVGGALKSALGRRDEIVLDVVVVVFGVSSA